MSLEDLNQMEESMVPSKLKQVPLSRTSGIFATLLLGIFRSLRVNNLQQSGHGSKLISGSFKTDHGNCSIKLEA